jgi:hypothetical protein
MGKWTRLKERFDREVSSHVEKVQTAKKDYVESSDRVLAELYRGILAEIDQLDVQLNELKIKKEAIAETLIQRWEDHDQLGARFDGIGNFTIVDDIYPKTVDQVKLFDWLRKEGAGGLIKETVHNKSLASFVKEYLEMDRAIPSDDTIKCYFKRSLRVSL